MARIRRQDLPESKSETFWKIGLYIRLSKEDENIDESESIVNQEKILRDFVKDYFRNASYKIIDIFADDGSTGTDTRRPGFLRLQSSVIQGRINCIIIKSLARGFRNLADQQKFLEEFIPLHNARFICMGTPFIDNHENPHSAWGLEVPIRGIFNEQFAATTSDEVRRTFRMKRERGEFIGAFAPYGYEKDPDNKNKLIVDEEAAQVVRLIFHLYVREGYSKIGIAAHLNDLGILNPEGYKRKKGLKYSNPNSQKNDGLWSVSTISKILDNLVYTGSMVQGKSRIISYKVHKQISIPREEWIVVPGTHEAIVDKETFDLAKTLQKKDTRTAPGKNKIYLMSGLVRCGDCKKAMRRKASRGYVYYSCRSYSEKHSCFGHSIRLDRLENSVLKAIQLEISAEKKLPQLLKKLSSLPPSKPHDKFLYRTLENTKSQRRKLENAFYSLYIDWKNGDLTRDEYARLKKDIYEEINKTDDKIVSLETDLVSDTSNSHPKNILLEDLLKNKNITSLSRGLLIELIDTIWVYKSNEITIEFNFSKTKQ